MVGVIVQCPAVDWITFTTFDDKEKLRLMNGFWDASPQDAKQAHQMQYRGVEKHGVFVGLADMRREPPMGSGELERSTMLRAWGSQANDVLCDLGDPPMSNCTRIDLQITIPLPFQYSARALKDLLDNSEWQGRKRVLQLIESGGWDTVGIGSRSSNRYIRIYVKEIDGARWLRFEVEYREERAQSVYTTVSAGSTYKMGGILRHEIDQLPEVAEPGMVSLREVLYQCAVKVVPVERVTTPDGRLDWLRRSVDPVIRRMAYDHDSGQQVRELVKKWAQYIDDLDKSSKPLTKSMNGVKVGLPTLETPGK